MRYYLIEISTGDTKIAGKAVYEYDNKNAVLAEFHSKLGIAMKSDLYESEQVVVIDSNNGIIAMEKFTR